VLLAHVLDELARFALHVLDVDAALLVEGAARAASVEDILLAVASQS